MGSSEKAGRNGNDDSSIAVVIPAFNRPKLLLRAIHSVLEQELAADEFVVVDDGSTEDSSEVRRLLEQERGTWIERPCNGGPAAARNEGVQATSSTWISFLDSDDEWLPGKLQAQVSFHHDHPEMPISHVEEQWVRSGKLVLKPAHWKAGGGDLFESSLQRCSIGPSCVMLSRDLWNECGGFDERFRVCEDYELWLRITEKFPVGLASEEPLVRKHAGTGDQLSFTMPAMDRYRVAALLEFLKGRDEDDTLRRKTLAALSEKAGIVADGAGKRGREERARLYRDLVAATERGAFKPGEWTEAIWNELREENSSEEGFES